MDYKLTPDGTGIIRTKDGASIPASAGNSDFKAYQTWLAAGNVPDPPDVISFIPVRVSPLQARNALRKAGLIDKVNAAVAASTPDVQDAWQYANYIDRSSPIIAALAAQLGLTSDDLDGLFKTAASL